MAETIAQGGESQKPIRFVYHWFIGLLLLGLFVRVLLWLTYEPISFGDSGPYLRLGAWILGIGERGFDGTRVPGYPIFMALFGLDPTWIWMGQMTLGIVISGLLFYLGWRTTGRAWVGFLLGSLYNLIPGQLFFEANLLTETLTTFFVVLTSTLFYSLIRSSSLRSQLFLAAGLGISASLIGMVRPLFFPLTLLLLAFLWFGNHDGVKQRLSLIAAYALFPLIIQGGWLLYMRSHWGVLSPTTMAGFSMVQHTGGYFEYLPDEYAAIRDTYIEYRDAQIAERGVQTNAIWEAIPAISEASGIGFYNLSKEMNRLSWMLIREHPMLYLQNVVIGWVDFWKAPVYWQPEVVQSTLVRTILQALSWVGRGLSAAANFMFLLLGVCMLISRKLRSWIRMDSVLCMGLAMVWLISIVQTLFDHGDNPRFLVPMQMIVIFVVVASVQRIRGYREATRPRL